METFLQQHSVHFYSRQHSVAFKRFVQHPFFSSKQMGEAIERTDRDSRVFGEESKRRDSFEAVALSCPCVKFCLQDRANT